jgi:hypothetical protein
VVRNRKVAPPSLSPDELRKIILKHIPAWARACSADSQAIVMHEMAFGTSDGELFLFGCAIKYAASTGKTVHVTCGQLSAAKPHGLPFHPASIDEIYRDEKKLHFRPSTVKRRQPGRKAGHKG